jgi:signal transduction histidine kinase
MPMSEMDIDSVIAEDAMIYGTTVDENIFGIEDFKAIMKMQAEEMEGLDISYERIPVSQHHSENEGNAIFVEEVKMTVKVGEEVSISDVRISFIMEKFNGVWKLIHAHGSKPVESQEDPWHIKEWEAEKKRLEQKVAEQTSDLQHKNQELEIEAATERIRSRAMAMEKPDDIWKVLGVIKEEVEAFEMGNISTWLFTFTEDGKVIHREMADYHLDGEVQDNHSIFDPEHYSAAKMITDKWGEDFFSLRFVGESLLTFVDSVSEIDPEQTQNFREAIESGQIVEFWQVCASFSKGIMGVSFISTPPENTEQILLKITDAFGLAYKRFEDLQQAEKRRHEAELEAAVERVRAHAMGMQEPNDIMNVLNVMKEEVDKFELGNIATWIWTKDEDSLITQWDISEVIEEGNLVNVNLRFDINKWPEVNRHAQEWKKGKKYYALNWRGEKLQDIVDEVGEIDPESGKFFQELVDSGQIEDYWHAAAPFLKGAVGLDFTTKPPEITESILLKMSSAFDMAYQRFEDLQEAERRARETQIETVLERVRSRSLAMHQTSELQDVIKTVHQQFNELNIDISGGAFIVVNERLKNGFYCWGTGGAGEYIQEVQIPFIERPIYNALAKGIKNGKGFFTEFYSNEEKKEFFRHLYKHHPFKLTPDSRQKELLSLEGGYARSCVVYDHTSIFIINHHGKPFSEEENDILRRMGRVFEQAYTRFMDLEKAEKQAYESKVEASLERVRGMAAAMNHSDDLMQIAEAMFKEMEILQINPLRYGVAMIDNKKKEAELWASTVNDGHYLDMLGTIPLEWHPMLKQAYEAWDAQHEELIYKLEGKELSDYYQRIGPINPEIPDLESLQNPDTDIVQYCSFFPFNFGILYAFTNGKPSDEGRSILTRFSSVFEQAHIRYHDLQTSERQARQIREERDRLELALKELEATKDQLVQQEKLASLGQLTAGIAHEIKNPLNFVNNFSEVSVELIEETKEELSAVSDQLSAEDQEKIEEALDILNDIEMNLRKIHEHGSRADSIVKSMLEHSRGGTGKPEATDVNSLIKEFVNLSFHGMRASKTPINVDLQFELDDSVGQVPLIAEDFSRVIVNLSNNAFDAMREKLLAVSDQPSATYKPVLTVRTRSESGKVAFDIEDNGSGIPSEMRDKILQPFFTTKKGTQGTGLGLSITNDIIKAHGGSMIIESESGQGTNFKIVLTR